MSKAFTRESDDEADMPVLPRQPSPLPPGAKNYVTPGGAQRLREELERLIEQRRGAASADDAEAKRRLAAVDQRIRYLQHSVESAVVVPAPAPPWDQVRFGATVTVRDRAGEASVYRLVGVDETDIDRGWVSYLSPIAKALLNARLGGRVKFRFPAGEEELEVVKIEWEG
ncbi:MAG: GreA/GreB family elongation factor [Verrucomicrobiota bacterium]